MFREVGIVLLVIYMFLVSPLSLSIVRCFSVVLSLCRFVACFKYRLSRNGISVSRTVLLFLGIETLSCFSVNRFLYFCFMNHELAVHELRFHRTTN